MNQDLRTSGRAAAQAAVQRALTAAVGHIGAGRLDEAVAALEADGGLALKNPVGRNILGDIRLKQGRPRDAVKDFEAAVRMVPSFPEAHANRGVALQALGRLNEALAAEERALSYRPDYATAHFNRGNILEQIGRREEAIAAFGRALKAQPGFPEALLNRGNALIANGQPLEALKDFRRTIELRPGYVAAHLGVAAIQIDLRQFDTALASIDAALAIDAQDRAALRMRGKTLFAAGRYEEALATVDASLAQHPDDGAAHVQRSHVLERLRRYDEALAAADAALGIDARNHEAHTVRGFVLGQLGRHEEQWVALDLAERLGADSHAFHHARAVALGESGRYDEALAAFGRAIAAEPDNPISHFHQSFVHLTNGDFKRGWAEYEWRLRMPDYARAAFLKLAPAWKGEDISDRKVLLHSEQGHGDAIQFVRYAPLVQARGARVSLVVHEPLRRLFAESLPGIDVAGDIGMRSGFDYQASLMSLPLVFGSSEAAIPKDVPYLAASPERVAKWSERLGAGGFRIGIAWQGNPAYPADRHRSIPLARFAPLAGVPGVRLISLQLFNGLDQLANLPAGMHVETLGEEVLNNPDGFREMAAVLANLDLLITSDTAPAHLAGALGRPVWVALRDRPDWRWLLGRSDSPWYPTMRLFRQKARGDWAGLFEEIAAALASEIAARKGP